MKASVVDSILSYYKQGRRRDVLCNTRSISYYQQGRRRTALCNTRSTYTEASSSQSLKDRITVRISQDPDWPTVVSIKNFCIFITRFLTFSPSPPIPLGSPFSFGRRDFRISGFPRRKKSGGSVWKSGNPEILRILKFVVYYKSRK